MRNGLSFHLVCLGHR